MSDGKGSNEPGKPRSGERCGKRMPPEKRAGRGAGVLDSRLPPEPLIARRCARRAICRSLTAGID